MNSISIEGATTTVGSYTCPSCSVWVPAGTVHACQWTTPNPTGTYPVYPQPTNYHYYTFDISPLVGKLEEVLIQIKELRKDIVVLTEKI